MTRYFCQTCGTAFDAPLCHVSTERIDGHNREDREDLCPICCTPYFDEADACPKCGGPKLKTDLLCRPCRRALRDRVIDFADTLTAEEEAQLDDWLDGESVTNRRSWT